MKNLHFNIILRPEDEGGYTVIVPSLPGCITYGKDLEEAEKMAKEAIEGYIETKEELEEEIQDDSKIFIKSINLTYA